jgi:uncharacterized protein (DUF362 family)
MSKIGIYIGKNIRDYPEETPFHPDTNYPEYLFKGNLTKSNKCYDAVRNCLHLMKLDDANFGKAHWNPLTGFVKPGDNVVIKPNLVFHSFELQDRDRVRCTITNGSIIRAVLDYVIIALEGKGSIVIADAPIEAADFDAILDYTGIREMIAFVKQYTGVDICYRDLRVRRVLKDKAGVRNGSIDLHGDPLGLVEINLGEDSYFNDLDKDKQNYLTVADWTIDHENPMDNTKGMTNIYHGKGLHKYKISKTYLNADAIISIGKMKTHKKAGVTLSMKNFIGICPTKECMPHHRAGMPPEGDAFPFYPGKIKMKIKKYITLLKYKTYIRRFISVCVKPIIYRFTSPDAFIPVQQGNWHGNDTLWRTILDLNKIIRYADKHGIVSSGKKRRLFFLIDGIIAGEGDGPLQNKPKRAGLIAASDTSPQLDSLLATIMGYDAKKIPHIIMAEKKKAFDVSSNDDQIYSNVLNLNSINMKFKTPIGWKVLMR